MNKKREYKAKVIYGHRSAQVSTPFNKIANNSRFLNKVENLIHLMHNNEVFCELQKKAEEKLDWTKNNVTIGSLVKTNCNYVTTTYYCGRPEETKENLSEDEADYNIMCYVAGTAMLFLGFEQVRLWKDPIIEKTLEEPTFEIHQKWLINNQIILTDIYPAHFDLTKKGSGTLWATALKELYQACIKQHKLVYGNSFKLNVLIYQNLINFWSGAVADNPVQISIFRFN